MSSCLEYLAKIMSTMFLISSTVTNALAQDIPDNAKIWSTIGSAGTLDMSSTNRVFFAQSAVQLGTVTTTGPIASLRTQIVFPPHLETAVLRYNVTPVDGLFDPFIISPSTGVQLKLRYLAVNAQVVAKLFAVDLELGVESLESRFDSNQFPAVNGYHVDEVDDCQPHKFGGVFFFDFTKKAYYIEATLTADRIQLDSAAGIQTIQLVKCAPGELQ